MLHPFVGSEFSSGLPRPCLAARSVAWLSDGYVVAIGIFCFNQEMLWKVRKLFQELFFGLVFFDPGTLFDVVICRLDLAWISCRSS